MYIYIYIYRPTFLSLSCNAMQCNHPSRASFSSLPNFQLLLYLSLLYTKGRKFSSLTMKGKQLVETCMSKWRKMGSKVIPFGGCDYCCKDHWGLWAAVNESKSIPRDVPKGHLAVYVGEDYKRFVIKITLLKHPLFKALLEQAKDEYDFTAADSKLCIPCHEKMFLHVLRCASSPQQGTTFLCL